ncbi:MAG: glycosyltransferase family 4 protein [Syntrophaceticus sp.]|nr:glycosyltransferase family 4 protein [Syntrophaceticus sp.]
MRILMFSWEYPPRSVGGLAQHVYDLTTALAAAGDEVHLITVGDAGSKEQENIGGLHIYRLQPYNLSAPDFLTWILQLNFRMVEYAIPLVNSLAEIDLIHAHDWLVAYAGRALKQAYKVPLIATIHATEYGRNQGLHNDLQRYISDVEWWLTYEAWRVIVCSHYMEQELTRVFQLPTDKIRVVPNGVDLDRYQRKDMKHLSREQYAAPGEKIVFFVGRLVREKGAEVLLDAVPKVFQYYSNAKFVIAGKGPALDYLKNKASDIGLYDRVFFTGYIDDDTRDFLYGEADVAVFPSLYEPFGMVTLEAMAARTPVVVSDVGGLGEIVQHETNGLKCYPGNPNSLADNILRLLHEPDLANRLAERAYSNLRKQYTWDEIAHQTRDVYAEVHDDYDSSIWKTDSWLAKVDLQENMSQGIADLGRYAVPGYLMGEQQNKELADTAKRGRYH